MPRRHLLVMVILVVAVVCAGSVPLSARSAADASSPCGLRLPPPQRSEIPFRTPTGGRAVRGALTARLVLCTLFRRDGSRFARLHIDAEQHVLGVAFYQPSGALLSAVDSSYVATSPSPANVKCGSSAQATIGTVYWKKVRKWWIGATPGGMNRDAVVKAVRNAQSEWTNDINWCGIKDQASPPASYQGKTSNDADTDDGKSVVDWGSLDNDQDCSGAIACTATWYDKKGTPIESDIRFNTAYKWSTTGAAVGEEMMSRGSQDLGPAQEYYLSE
jgi:hypothetical protein